MAYSILIVDDEQELREGIANKVDWASLGIAPPLIAENGREALEKALDARPEIIVTDIRMPFLDGLSMLKELRRSLPSVKSILLTGYDDFAYAKTGIELGVSEYLLKPVGVKQLTESLLSVVAQLDEERRIAMDTRRLQEQYELALPILKEKYFSDLISGKLSVEQILNGIVGYSLPISETNCFAVALVELSEAFGEEIDSVTEGSFILSAKAMLDTSFNLKGADIFTFFYGNSLAVLIQLEQGLDIFKIVDELSRMVDLARSALPKEITIGLGLKLSGPWSLLNSLKGAVSALEYRAIWGDSRVLYIGDLERISGSLSTLGEEFSKQLSNTIKFGEIDGVERLIRKALDGISTHTLAQGQLVVSELVHTLLMLADGAGMVIEDVFGDSFKGVVAVTDFSSGEDLTSWCVERGRILHEQLLQQRGASTVRLTEQAKEIVLQNYSDSTLSLDTVCELLHLSQSYFSALFKKTTGENFVSFVTRTRMEAAKELLLSTDERTYVIAERTGFDDPNYFSYVFRRHFGQSPTKYREASRR